MKLVNNCYPLALLAFSLFLVWTNNVWFSLLVFIISAMCWFALQIDLNKEKTWEDV